MRSGAKGGGQGWTALLADDSKGVHGKSISPATSPRGRSLLWFTLRLRLGNLGFVDVDSLACRSALGLPALASAGNVQAKMARTGHFFVPRLQVPEALFDSFVGLSGSSMTFAWQGGRCEMP